jgi:hypothetical protein
LRRHLFAPGDDGEASVKTSFEFQDQHFFTPQEASKLLPDVRLKLRELIELKRVVFQLHVELERYGLLGFETEAVAEKAAQFDALLDELMKKTAELEDLGVRVRDLDYGAVDFPADRYGEKVMLCWRYGEPEVSYWHKPDEGFPSRKPLKAELIQP